jgi:hypothetical protein
LTLKNNFQAKETKKSGSLNWRKRRDDKAIERNTYWQRKKFSRLNEGNKKNKAAANNQMV